MALATKERVSIPEHCVKVHKGDHVYIQYTVRAYRNSKGKLSVNLIRKQIC